MAVQQIGPSSFNGARTLDWLGSSTSPGSPAELFPNSYAHPASGVSITVEPAAAGQVVIVSVCGALGLRCNVEEGTGLLLATNVTASPVRLSFSSGVKSAGAFVVAQAAFGTPFTAVMWVWLERAQAWFSVFTEGVTGDIFSKIGDVPAPFVGARAPAGDTITKAYFDCVHPTNELFSPLGIGRLYFREA